MIAFRDDLPLVRFGGGEVAAFERGWLVCSLVQAAQKAGYPHWWLAEHVAESVTSYLSLRCDEPVVAAPRLAKAVQSVLQVIGYSEIARHFVAGPPPVRISLLEIAHAAGAGYELAFFELLGRALSVAIKGHSNYCEITGVERCVRQLRAKKIWSRDCDALRSEIVAFVRDQIEGANPNQGMVCALS
ncbi:MAG: hypothetical protein QOD99_2678 [Chthoniobacter sp.]|jgi:hypothetical protein|nr:hypothetical protein [Chthoniobacter sp.]